MQTIKAAGWTLALGFGVLSLGQTDTVTDRLEVIATDTGGPRTPLRGPAVRGAPGPPTDHTDYFETVNIGANGGVNRTAYQRMARQWNREGIEARLGPAFDDLHPGAKDDRPTLFKPPSRECKLSFVNRSNPYEAGAAECHEDNDYWSDSGQVGYVPDDPVNDPGLDRIQTFAYYNYVFALSPRLDYASGTPHPDPQTQETNYRQMLGGPPRQPIAMVRNYGMLQNEALVLYRGGLLAVAGTQTSRADHERPYPGLLFPKHKVPTAIAVTTENEFALIAIWDTEKCRGQLAVVALEGKYIPFHTWPYMALPNQGSWSDFKLLGYVDLPIATPSAVSAAANGWWNGPSATANKVLSQIDLADENNRKTFYDGDWRYVVADQGYAMVASRLENKVVFVDLTPLFAYVRKSYLSSAEGFQSMRTNRPSSFSERPDIAPRVVVERSIPQPTAVLAGMRVGRWSDQPFKAYVASEDGTIRVFDTSSFMARFEWEKRGEFKEIGAFNVGRNPVSMIFNRHGDVPESAQIKKPANGKVYVPDPLNDALYIACRGDREVVGLFTYNGEATIYRRIRDSRMGDPVAVSLAMRGNVLSVADFRGRKVLSFRIGRIVDRHGATYGAGADGNADFEFAGELPVAGTPFLINSTNVN
jgi:hypothetical protein